MEQYIKEIPIAELENFIFCKRNNLRLNMVVAPNLIKLDLNKNLHNEFSAILRLEGIIGKDFRDITFEDLISSDEPMSYNMYANSIFIRYFNFELAKSIIANKKLSRYQLEKNYRSSKEKIYSFNMHTNIEDIYLSKYKTGVSDIFYYRTSRKNLDLDNSIKMVKEIINIVLHSSDPINDSAKVYVKYKSELKGIVKFKRTVIEALKDENREIYRNLNRHLENIKINGSTKSKLNSYKSQSQFIDRVPFVAPLVYLATGKLESEKYHYYKGYIDLK